MNFCATSYNSVYAVPLRSTHIAIATSHTHGRSAKSLRSFAERVAVPAVRRVATRHRRTAVIRHRPYANHWVRYGTTSHNRDPLSDIHFSLFHFSFSLRFDKVEQNKIFSLLIRGNMVSCRILGRTVL